MSLRTVTRLLRSTLTFVLVAGFVLLVASFAARLAHGCVPNVHASAVAAR